MNAEHKLSQKIDNPLAFDLALEREKTLRYDESYYETFLDNAHTFANETYARTPIQEYYQEIGADGSLLFQYGDGYVSAAERVLEPYLNPNMPNWYRGRALREHAAIKALEGHIAHARPGQRFFEFSPAPFEVPERFLEGTAFGRHSFARTYEVVYDEKKGRNRLLGKAHLNYLTPQAQAQLFQELTGSSVEPDQLLGSIGELPADIDIEQIQRVVAAVPKEYTVDPPKNAPDRLRSEQIKKFISERDHYLEALFLLMLDPSTPERTIVSRFQDWEKIIMKYANGEEYIDEFSASDSVRMTNDAYYMTAKMRDVRNQKYEAWENSCGRGSGSSSSIPGSYEDLTKELLGEAAPESEWKWKKGDCRPEGAGGCGAKGVLVGPCNICKKCQDKYDKKEMK